MDHLCESLPAFLAKPQRKTVFTLPYFEPLRSDGKIRTCCGVGREASLQVTARRKVRRSRSTEVKTMLTSLAPGRHLLSAAARKLNIHVSTWHRWRSKGVRGQRLTCTRIGGRWYVDSEDFQAFVEALSSVAEAHPRERQKPERKQHAHAERAGQVLDVRIFGTKSRVSIAGSDCGRHAANAGCAQV